jgi:hypothetical protein
VFSSGENSTLWVATTGLLNNRHEITAAALPPPPGRGSGFRVLVEKVQEVGGERGVPNSSPGGRGSVRDLLDSGVSFGCGAAGLSCGSQQGHDCAHALGQVTSNCGAYGVALFSCASGNVPACFVHGFPAMRCVESIAQALTACSSRGPQHNQVNNTASGGGHAPSNSHPSSGSDSGPSHSSSGTQATSGSHGERTGSPSGPRERSERMGGIVVGRDLGGGIPK